MNITTTHTTFHPSIMAAAGLPPPIAGFHERVVDQSFLALHGAELYGLTIAICVAAMASGMILAKRAPEGSQRQLAGAVLFGSGIITFWSITILPFLF